MQELWRIRTAVEIVLGAAMIVLLMYCTFRLALAGAWLEGFPVPLLVLVIGYYTRQRYREMRGLVHPNV